MTVKWERQTHMIDSLRVVVFSGAISTEYEARVIQLSADTFCASVKRGGEIVESNYSAKSRHSAKLWGRKALKSILPAHLANQI